MLSQKNQEDQKTHVPIRIEIMVNGQVVPDTSTPSPEGVLKEARANLHHAKRMLAYDTMVLAVLGTIAAEVLWYSYGAWGLGYTTAFDVVAIGIITFLRATRDILPLIQRVEELVVHSSTREILEQESHNDSILWRRAARFLRASFAKFKKFAREDLLKETSRLSPPPHTRNDHLTSRCSARTENMVYTSVDEDVTKRKEG